MKRVEATSSVDRVENQHRSVDAEHRNSALMAIGKDLASPRSGVTAEGAQRLAVETSAQHALVVAHGTSTEWDQWKPVRDVG